LTLQVILQGHDGVLTLQVILQGHDGVLTLQCIIIYPLDESFT